MGVAGAELFVEFLFIERSKENGGNLNELHHIQTHPLDIMNSEKTKKRKENSATEPEQ